MIKEFRLEEGSGYALADSQNENNPPAYLGILFMGEKENNFSFYTGGSTDSSNDLTNSPLWGLNVLLLQKFPLLNI